MNNKIRMLALNAMVAGIYAVLTILIAPIAYNDIQCRISEVLVLLSFYNRKYIPGLVVGCFIANMFSTMASLDMIFGTLATFIVCIAMVKLSNIYAAVTAGALINGIIIGAELTYAFQTPYALNVLWVFIGEFIALLIGVYFFKIIIKNDNLKQFLEL